MFEHILFHAVHIGSQWSSAPASSLNNTCATYDSSCNTTMRWTCDRTWTCNKCTIVCMLSIVIYIYILDVRFVCIYSRMPHINCVYTCVLHASSIRICRAVPRCVTCVVICRLCLQYTHIYKTCSDLCVGSEFDEECSEMYYAVWFVRFREPRETCITVCVHASVSTVHSNALNSAIGWNICQYEHVYMYRWL